MLQINGVGTVDEIYKQVHPVFSSFNFEVFGFCFPHVVDHLPNILFFFFFFDGNQFCSEAG